MALGGALGNGLVRVLHGAVTDWIHLGPYPATFNLADDANRGGLLVWLADTILRAGQRRNTHSAQRFR